MRDILTAITYREAAALCLAAAAWVPTEWLRPVLCLCIFVVLLFKLGSQCFSSDTSRGAVNKAKDEGIDDKGREEELSSRIDTAVATAVTAAVAPLTTQVQQIEYRLEGAINDQVRWSQELTTQLLRLRLSEAKTSLTEDEQETPPSRRRTPASSTCSTPVQRSRDHRTVAVTAAVSGERPSAAQGVSNSSGTFMATLGWISNHAEADSSCSPSDSPDIDPKSGSLQVRPEPSTEELLPSLKKKDLPSLKNDGEVFTRGSQGHPATCKPCSWYCFSNRGCRNDKDCEFCHMMHVSKSNRRSLAPSTPTPPRQTPTPPTPPRQTPTPTRSAFEEPPGLQGLGSSPPTPKIGFLMPQETLSTSLTSSREHSASSQRRGKKRNECIATPPRHPCSTPPLPYEQPAVVSPVSQLRPPNMAATPTPETKTGFSVLLP